MQTTDWIASINVLVTAAFSFLVWRVSKQSYLLSKTIVTQQAETEKVTREVYVKKVRRMAETILNAVLAQDFKLDLYTLKQAPRDHGLQEEELAKYFTAAQRKNINNIWSLFNEYINKCYLDSAGQWKSMYYGDDMKLIQDVQGDYINSLRVNIEEFDKEQNPQ